MKMQMPAINKLLSPKTTLVVGISKYHESCLAQNIEILNEWLGN